MEKHILSKSTFIRSWQCLKSLYLYKNKYHLRDPITPEQKAIFSRGTDVGMLARKLFPGGVDASPESPFKYRESVIKTQELIKAGATVIYEAAFQYEQVLAAMDILVKQDTGWVAYEVKSSTRITGVYLLDASLQHFVIKRSGLDLQDICLATINTEYTRKGELELKKLFNITSVLAEAEKNEQMVSEKIRLAKSMIAHNQEPDIKIGEHCFHPYPCDFRGVCWQQVPNNSVFEIAGLSKAEQFELYLNKGFKTIGEIPDDHVFIKMDNTQVKSFKENKVLIQQEELQQFVDSLSYPLYFLDFETFMPAVPVFDNTKPYQHIPFQYSLHLKESKTGEVRHLEYLAQSGIDPRKEFLERLLSDTEGIGDILVYSAMFETGVLKAFQKEFPAYAAEIDQRLSRIKDLMIPFQKKWYYHPMMKGSYSIKNILPAMVSGLNYDELVIGSGGVAMAAFENLNQEMDIFKIAEIRDALLSYCKMDTYGMVKIVEVLEKEVEKFKV